MFPRVESTPIVGLRRIDLDLRNDDRGWFEETWQAEKFAELGLGFFSPLQSNASHNLQVGVTRGLHAEPWSKLVTVTNGRVFSAWVDLRPGRTFGAVHTAEIRPGISYFIPKGVANGYQAVEDSTTYAYLVDGIWKPGLAYEALNPFDPALKINWPIGAAKAFVSPKDSNNPDFEAARYVDPRPTFIFGSGQVSKALQAEFPKARVVSRKDYDFGCLSMPELLELLPFDSIVLNAAAFTNVDAAESLEGSEEATRLNFEFPKRLALACKSKSATLVHISSEYVFNGESSTPYSEQDDPSPRSKYGITKLLGDFAIESCPHHFLIRTSWVFGDGKNFVKTILDSLKQGRRLSVVNDQFGRPTSARELARFIKYALESNLDFGTYNLTCSGELTSWFDLAMAALDAAELKIGSLQAVTTEDFSVGKKLAPRPKHGMLNLSKVESAGFTPRDWKSELVYYVESLGSSA